VQIATNVLFSYKNSDTIVLQENYVIGDEYNDQSSL